MSINIKSFVRQKSTFQERRSQTPVKSTGKPKSIYTTILSSEHSKSQPRVPTLSLNKLHRLKTEGEEDDNVNSGRIMSERVYLGKQQSAPGNQSQGPKQIERSPFGRDNLVNLASARRKDDQSVREPARISSYLKDFYGSNNFAGVRTSEFS